MQKQQSCHQQHQSQYQQHAPQHLPIQQSPLRQNSLLKGQYAMHQRETLKSKHQARQMENHREVSKTSQENEPLLIVPGERSYKDTPDNLWI